LHFWQPEKKNSMQRGLCPYRADGGGAGGGAGAARDAHAGRDGEGGEADGVVACVCGAGIQI